MTYDKRLADRNPSGLALIECPPFVDPRPCLLPAELTGAAASSFLRRRIRSVGEFQADDAAH
jgi:hypothetical protein